MPVGQGWMIINRLNAYNTATALNVVESSPYTCGETIHFHVVVTNISVGTPTPTGGTVQIFDLISSSVIASGTLSAGTVTIPYVLSTGTIAVVAQYLGTTSPIDFNASQSSPFIPISAAMSSTSTSITSPSPGFDFCAQSNLNVTANVSGTGSPTGNVQFYYWTDNTHSHLFDTQPLSGGNANGTLVGGTLTGSSGGTEYWLSANYVGTACFAASASPSGTSGTDVFAFAGVSTATSITSPSSGDTITNAPPVTMDISVTASLTVNTGLVTLWYAFSPNPSPTPPANFPTGWTQVPVNVDGSVVGAQNNPVSVSGNTATFFFPSNSLGGGNSFFYPFGNYYFVAVYSDGSCFGGSMTNGVGTEAYFLMAAGT